MRREKRGHTEKHVYGEEGRNDGQTLKQCRYKPKNARTADKHQKLEEAGNDSSLKPSEGSLLCTHLDFILLALRTMER